MASSENGRPLCAARSVHTGERPPCGGHSGKRSGVNTPSRHLTGRQDSADIGVGAMVTSYNYDGAIPVPNPTHHDHGGLEALEVIA